MQACTLSEIEYIISNLKLTKQVKDHVPIRLLIENRNLLSSVICDMVNRSMMEGRFPDSLKIAKIIPVYKKGDPKLLSNYRPISILPYLSKIFEKVFHNRIACHLANNNILSPSQFGFIVYARCNNSINRNYI